MQNTNEKAAVSIISIFITIALVGLLTVLVPIAILKFTIFNPDFVRDTFTNESIISPLTKQLNKDVIEDLNDDGYEFDEDSTIYSEEFMEEFMIVLVDYFITGEPLSLDNEKFDKMIDEDIIPFFEKEMDLTPEELDILAEEIHTSFDEDFEDAMKDEDPEIENFAEEYASIGATLTSSLIVLGVICLVLALIMLIIYKKKHRAVRNVGIALTIAGAIDVGLGSVFTLALNSVFTQLYEEEMATSPSESDELIVECILEGFKSLTTPFISLSAIVFAAGIVLIIITCIIASNFKKSLASNDIYYNSGSSVYYSGENNTYYNGYNNPTNGNVNNPNPSQPGSTNYYNQYNNDQNNNDQYTL